MCCAFCTSTENDITQDSISIQKVVTKKNCRIGIVDFICVAPSSVSAFCGTGCTDSSTRRPAGGGRVKITTANNPPKAIATRYNIIPYRLLLFVELKDYGTIVIENSGARGIKKVS